MADSNEKTTSSGKRKRAYHRRPNAPPPLSIRTTKKAVHIALRRDPKEHIQPGTRVLVIGRSLTECDFHADIITVSQFPSVFLHAGQTRWGATYGFPDSEGALIESGPMLESQFLYDEQAQIWLLLLV